MPRKRIKKKKKRNINFEILNEDLIELICWGYFYFDLDGSYDIRKDIDLNDLKLVKKIWDMHKEQIMDYWRLDVKGNSGRRPKFFWIINEAIKPKRISGNKKETDYGYLKRLKMLEKWEIEEFERLQKLMGKGNIYEQEWERKVI